MRPGRHRSVRIPALVDDALVAEAERRQTTASDLVVRALTIYLGAAAIEAGRPARFDDDAWVDLLARIEMTIPEGVLNA